MSNSHAVGWVSDSPTPAQLEEFFAQVGSGRITKDRLQSFLRGDSQVEEDWFSFTTTGASLKELRDQNSELFHRGSDWWFNQPFAKKRGQAGGKLQIRTSTVFGSFNKTFVEQQELLSDGEFVPTVRDLVEGMIAYYRETGKRLFSDYWVRTSDVSTDGYRVDVRFCSDGVGVFSDWDGSRSSLLGLAVARKS
jgi:hypothetical protein